MRAVKRFILFITITSSVFVGYYFYNQKNIVKNTEGATQKYAAQLKNDSFPLKGAFRWTFNLGPVEQTSTHTFSPKHIDYRMTGKVHSTDYRIQQLSYDNSNKKWIGQTTDGLVYTIFFKIINDKNVIIYKHKCKQGLPEAIALKYPTDDTTTDHGWNIYTREGASESKDNLPFGGIFHNDNQSFELHDNKATWQNKTYQKLTHHFGERRWVGKNDNHYLVIFYEIEAGAIQGKFSIKVVEKVEAAYKLKHNQQKLIHFKMK